MRTPSKTAFTIAISLITAGGAAGVIGVTAAQAAPEHHAPASVTTTVPGTGVDVTNDIDDQGQVTGTTAGDDNDPAETENEVGDDHGDQKAGDGQNGNSQDANSQNDNSQGEDGNDQGDDDATPTAQPTNTSSSQDGSGDNSGDGSGDNSGDGGHDGSGGSGDGGSDG